MAGRGFAVLSFDFTGLGESEGSFPETNFSGNVADLIAAAKFLEQEFEAPALLVGHSLGGVAVIQAAALIQTIKAIATIGSPAQADHIKKIFREGLSEIESKGMVEVDLGGKPFLIKQQFIKDLREHSVTQTLSLLQKAVLLLHSPQDEIVGIENAAELYQAANHSKSFISLDGADHLLSKKSDSNYAGEVIATWAARYLKLPEEPSLDTEHQTIASTGDEESGYTTLIKAGHHYITADEPEDAGGDDFGPTPYQLLSSSLAACTAMTLRMYANRKGLDVKEIKVHVDHFKRYSDDSANSNQPEARLDHFERLLEVDGNLTGEQLEHLVEIANKCPIHKTLLGGITITTKHLSSERK